jgi:hypothetical protein
VLALVLAGRREPAPAAFGAPEGEFSAARAQVILERLAGDGVPHPIGSEANDTTRDRLLAELKAVGLKPAVELGFACSPNASCATTQNIVARIHGTTPGPAIVLNAHYDSVPAGPGAGDDLSACAALVEVARALRSGWPPPRDIVLLFDDGEEAGLLGAEAWVRSNDPKSVGLMVVLEARGSSGRALMFETSLGNAEVVDAYARAADSPAASSLSFAIYQLLPNDTNFTVFKRAGMQGMAIAAIGDPAQYHTPANNVKNVSAGTIQHHGDVALALARSARVPDSTQASNASYFDVLGLVTIRWPERWNLSLALLATLFVLVPLGTGIRNGTASMRGSAIAFAAALLALAAAALLARGLVAIAELRTLRAPWPASGGWLEGAAWALAVAAVAFASHVARRRVSADDAWNAFGLVWAIGAITLAIVLPGGAYCIFVPLLFGGAVASLGRAPGRRAAPFVALGFGGLILFGVAIDLPLAMGVPVLPASALLIAMVALSCMPLLVAVDAGSRAGRSALVLAIASIVGFFVTPVWTPESPRPMSLVQYDAGGGARLVAIDVQATRAPSLPGEWKREPVPEISVGTRGARRSYWWTPVAPSGEPPPEATLESWAPQPGGVVRATIRLRSARGARVARLRLDTSLEPKIIRVGSFVLEKPAETGIVTVHTLGRDGVAVELEFTPKPGATITFQDETPDLPAAARGVAASRSAAMLPAHRGDRLVVSRTVGLTPALR